MNPIPDFSKPRVPEPVPDTPSRRSVPWRSAAVVLLVLLVIGAGAWAYSSATKKSQVSSLDPRFCKISLELGQVLASVGVPPAGPVPESVRPEAIRAALDSMGNKLSEFENVAPSKVRDDVKRVLADLRAATGGDTARTREAGFVNAEKRIAQVREPPNGCLDDAGPPAGDG